MYKTGAYNPVCLTFSESSSHHCATFPQKAKGKPAEAVIPALWKLKWSRAGTQ